MATPPAGPTDAFAPWPTLIAARMGVASDGSIWVYGKGAVTQVAAAGTIPHPMLAELGHKPPDGEIPEEAEDGSDERLHAPSHRGRRR